MYRHYSYINIPNGIRKSSLIPDFSMYRSNNARLSILNRPWHCGSLLQNCAWKSSRKRKNQLSFRSYRPTFCRSICCGRGTATGSTKLILFDRSFSKYWPCWGLRRGRIGNYPRGRSASNLSDYGWGGGYALLTSRLNYLAGYLKYSRQWTYSFVLCSRGAADAGRKFLLPHRPTIATT